VGDYDGQTNPILMETLSFPDVTYLPVKDDVDQKKVQLVEENEEFIESEAETVDPEKILQEGRNQSIKKVYENTDMTQADVAEAFGLSQPQVHRICTADSD
jgi:DNA-directed RNA polymerase specialized sigma subunit